MVAWAVVGLVRALIDWRGYIGYERARAASVVDVLRTVPAGATVRESHADGTVLCIEIPARQVPHSRGAYECRERTLLSTDEATQFWSFYRNPEALYRKAYRMCRGHRADADDALQRTYLRRSSTGPRKRPG